MSKGKRFVLLNLLLLTLLLIISLRVGQAKLSLKEALQALVNLSTPSNNYIVLNLRLTRSLLAIILGGGLALSGLVYQTIFKNDLCEPYILGVSSGASFFAALSLFLFPSVFSSAIFSSFGGIMVTLLILLISNKKGLSSSSLLLTGISISYIFSALVTLMLFLFQSKMKSFIFWSFGSLSSANYSKIAIALVVFTFTITLTYKMNKELDLFYLDEESAFSIGMDVKKHKLNLLLLAALTTSLVIGFAGPIGFVGLISPHITRRFVNNTHKALIPSTFLLGSNILLFSDIISRTVLKSGEAPIGVITALLGSPFFLYLLLRKRRKA